MAIEKFFKIIKPKSPNADITSNQDIAGNGGLYGNYTWYNKLTQGSSRRITQYREYDLMDADIDVSRALNIISSEMTGNNSKTNMPLDLQITAGNEQRVDPKTVVTLKAALNTWCKLHSWDTRLFAVVRSLLKYGDVFFARPKKKNRKWVYIHPKNVVGAVVAKHDVTEVRGWHIKVDNKELDAGKGSNSYFNLSANLYDQGVEVINNDDIVRFSLNDDTSEEAPFGFSILRTVFKTFRQKELLEDSLIIYRISRAPERRVFYIDTGKAPSHKVAAHLEQLKNEIRQRKIPSMQGGKPQVDSIYNPLSINEDYFFAVNGNNSSTRVETLPGGQSQSTEELEYFYMQMWKGLMIPNSYIGNSMETGQPFNDGAVGIAYIEEIKFSEHIERLQKFLDIGLDKEFKRFLVDNNIMCDPTVFRIQLPSPTSWSKSKQQKIDSECSNVYNNFKDDSTISKRFVKRKYLQWTEEELLINERMLREEKGLNPDGGIEDLPKLYAPEEAEMGGFEGGLGSVGGADGQVGDVSEEDIESGNNSESNSENSLPNTETNASNGQNSQ